MADSRDRPRGQMEVISCKIDMIDEYRRDLHIIIKDDDGDIFKCSQILFRNVIKIDIPRLKIYNGKVLITSTSKFKLGFMETQDAISGNIPHIVNPNFPDKCWVLKGKIKRWCEEYFVTYKLHMDKNFVRMQLDDSSAIMLKLEMGK